MRINQSNCDWLKRNCEKVETFFNIIINIYEQLKLFLENFVNFKIAGNQLEIKQTLSINTFLDDYSVP